MRMHLNTEKCKVMHNSKKLIMCILDLSGQSKTVELGVCITQKHSF